MSWWIYLEDDDGKNVTVDRHEEGGTYCMGGTHEAELNVTYNYGVVFRLAGLDFKGLQGMTGADATPILEAAVEKLGTSRFKDYWAPTPGNAGYALSIILRWAQEHPTARFRVS